MAAAIADNSQPLQRAAVADSSSHCRGQQSTEASAAYQPANHCRGQQSTEASAAYQPANQCSSSSHHWVAAAVPYHGQVCCLGALHYYPLLYY